jgi:hypothetical protein
VVATRAGPQMAPQPSVVGVAVVGVVVVSAVVVAGAAVVRPATGVVNVTSSGPSLRLLELAVASAAPAVVTPSTAVIVPTAVTATSSARVRRAVIHGFRPPAMCAM